MAILSHCPNCGTSVSPWFEVCGDCGCKLPSAKSSCSVEPPGQEPGGVKKALSYNYCPYCGIKITPWFDSCQNCGAMLRPSVFREPRNYERPNSTYANTRNLHIPTPSEFIGEANELRGKLMRAMSNSAMNNFIVVKDLFPGIIKCSEWPLYMGGEPLRKVDCWDLFGDIVKIVLDGIEKYLPSTNNFGEVKSMLAKIAESQVFDEDNIIRAMKIRSEIDESVVRKEQGGMSEYQELYARYKSKCCKCGGTPEPGILSICQMHGRERSDGEYWLIEFDVPVCRECEMRRRALLNEVYRKRADAQAYYEKKKKLMDFVVFGREKVLKEAYEPIRATYEEEHRLDLDNYFKEFPVIARLLSKGYSFGERYDTGMRGRGDFSKRPKNELRLI